MEKEIKIAFRAQSKGVVEEISVRYLGSSEEFINLDNEKILQETIDLQKAAESHALTAVFRR